ncbi:MAG: 1-deoxy-D-xylulose-5-phosphate reductoisomerase [Spiribacter sp.]|jgi:1-deoxy-D-xylulose-5-phosphate reductoisomerase|nr:1-deoxy-D-xylulose-5-phosphate reductoisomerase [Spiribacter sp.]MDR9489306.1 1-deoxy-D-xylulose-5-phosphate reductoisomerase [Spiribacter sp.]
MSASGALERIAIFGATGSIGTSTLDVLARHPDRYQVAAIAAHQDVKGMEALARRFTPEQVVMADIESGKALERALADLPGIVVRSGTGALLDMAADPQTDTVMAAITGAAGLSSCLAAVQAGKRVLLANKEALVLAGDLVLAAARTSGATLLPIDSEHNGLFQCLPGDVSSAPTLKAVDRLILTASGGPFRTRDPATLHRVSVAEACAHPNWSMGKKISVDSATMMNKGLEVIEASRLFSLPADQVEVLVHPQSLVHALVQYRDGSMLAQMGQADMRIPIAHALAWPARIDSGVRALDLASVAQLEFFLPDTERFPCLGLARAAFAAGSGATVALNAANEVAVGAFLNGLLRFDRIAGVIEATLSVMNDQVANNLDALLDYDQRARQCADNLLLRWSE